MTDASIRILIADDHPVVRNGLVLLIRYEPGMEPVAEACDGAEAIALYRQHLPDITLMDLRMPNVGGVEAIVTIRQAFPTARIILLTTYDGDEDIYRGLEAGARGYLLKDAPLEQVLEAIRRVHSGQNYVPPEVGAKLVARLSGPQLSDREREVLNLMAKGKSNQAMASELYISEATIKFHITNILSKLQVSDRTQAVLVALKRGIANL
ncbi:MAG: response regulator [Leptolyngbya sp. BL-A-14]